MSDPLPQTSERPDATPGAPGLETRRLQAAMERRLFGTQAAPPKVGRFVVLEPIGRGAWGTVFRAYDPDLDRAVAVKVLNSRLSGIDERQLLDEARTLAKLNHPNVVTVHEVGVSEGMVFMAMELAEGGTLRDAAEAHDDDTSRNAALLTLFVEAARGLEAAHRNGLIHRDLKPANLLIGGDGRLRIADFGLARIAVSADLPRTTIDSDLGAAETHAAKGTKGAWIGTPAYMAPEQFDGVSDERGDLFNLCAAFYEVFYGVLPFAGKTLVAVRENAEAGVLTPAPGRSVPGWIRSVLVRGLRAEPSQRFASATELLAALEKGAGKRRSGTLLLGGAVVVAGAVAWGAAGNDGLGSTCASEAADAAPQWSDATRSRIRDAFAQSGLVTHERGFAAVDAKLEQWVQRWVDEHERNCVAARSSRKAASTPAADDALVCLDTLAQGFSALTESLETTDTRAVSRAVLAVEVLTSPESCGEGAVGLEPGLVSVPKEYVSAIFRARTLQRLGQTPEAEALLLPLRPEFDAYPALAAKADCMLAGLAYSRGDYEQLDARTESCMREAEHGGLTRTLVYAWRLRSAFLVQARKNHEALFAIRRAESIARRPEVPPLERAGVQRAIGPMLRRLFRYDEALVAVERAYEMTLAEDGEASKLPELLCTWSETLFFAGKLDEALAKVDQCIDVSKAEFGGDAPKMAEAWAMRAQYLHHGGEYEKALAAAEESRRVIDLHPWISPMRKYVTAKQRANALLRLERFEEAEAIFGQIEELVREHFGPKGPRMMANHSDRGLLYEAWGDAQRSFEAYGQAAALADEGAAKGAVENAGIVYMNYAGELAQRGLEDEALKRLAQAMERLGPLRGDGTSLASLYRLRIAQVHRKLGRHEVAREALDHALRLAAEDPPDAPAPPAIWEEDARLRLAMDDRSGALASYGRATEGFVSRGKDAAPDLAKLKAWAKEVGLGPSVSR